MKFLPTARRSVSLLPLLALAACSDGDDASNQQTGATSNLNPMGSTTATMPPASMPVGGAVTPATPGAGAGQAPVVGQGSTGPTSTPGATGAASNPGAAVGPTGPVGNTGAALGDTAAGPTGGALPMQEGPTGPSMPMSNLEDPESPPEQPVAEPEPLPEEVPEEVPEEPATDLGGDWGLVEDPGAGCSVPEMPSVDSLTADPKLPDPFMKMDGTRISDKSEWRCRREELLQQAYEFIYGDKPVPPEGAVSGSVSNGSITVSVEDGGSTSFDVSVNMNGATAPAPAMIVYGGFGGPPVPNGVATITFGAMEQEGGSGPKNGPFYDVYGNDHPAGFLAAQAWQVSRIIDVLEQDPSVIDPYRIGVTGCSRLGKGAFVAGVLDNRIALTVPVESGLGGTVGLRLVEVIDSYSGSEWPYHGISYVRWMSEVALGPFANANSAMGDSTDRLPIDMHEMMGLIAPRGLYIVDNPSTMYNGLDRNSAWVTANVGQLIFEALGVGDHMAYEGASGSHCSWRNQYTPSFQAMVERFLLGNEGTATGNFNTDLPNAPSAADHYDWEVPTLSGEL